MVSAHVCGFASSLHAGLCSTVSPRDPWSPPCPAVQGVLRHRVVTRHCTSLLHAHCCTYENVHLAVSGTRHLSLCGATDAGSLRTSEACACRFCQSARALLGGHGEAEGCCCDIKFPPVVALGRPHVQAPRADGGFEVSRAGPVCGGVGAWRCTPAQALPGCIGTGWTPVHPRAFWPQTSVSWVSSHTPQTHQRLRSRRPLRTLDRLAERPRTQ